ncbi:zinc-binding dehydrogenase [Arthrobacter sp. H14-L1]|uniref:zinc-binding dehydrogenase n=1 Tax=Arthrobacter sp. H14-L1 TaxID=2996697 RepID=UPI00226F460B|nr:zinc-binding dehydrogenase [Arthrobacter sp. H14-L1]MCY0905285.1 zinc-binding dehydrogenase [Arthrobacter sp. H14-L1]
MRAVFATAISADDPLSGLEVGELDDVVGPAGWVKVRLKTSALNHHDLFSLRGMGLSADKLPMVLGCDGAGVDDEGYEVMVHSVIPTDGWRGDETLDPKRSLLSELHPGTFADYVWVPAANVLPKPAELSWEQAGCLSTAWLTAFKMLFSVSPAGPGSTVLVQGSGGGVATALIAMAAKAGFRVWVTGRTEAKRAAALSLGASEAFESGARLPERVDVVFDSVGQATWNHSLKSLKPGGAIVTCGATSGSNPPAELSRVFFTQLRILGSTMGSRSEFQRLAQFLVSSGARPMIDSVLPLERAREGFDRMLSGEVHGKIVFQH